MLRGPRQRKGRSGAGPTSSGKLLHIHVISGLQAILGLLLPGHVLETVSGFNLECVQNENQVHEVQGYDGRWDGGMRMIRMDQRFRIFR